jgi:hypothetical protein
MKNVLLHFKINFLEHHTFKNVNNCLNTNIYSYLETSGHQSSHLYLNVVHCSTPMLIRHLWQLKTALFLQRCLICAVLLARAALWSAWPLVKMPLKVSLKLIESFNFCSHFQWRKIWKKHGVKNMPVACIINILRS